ncbi:hypothetical protein ACVWZK_001466 [Bradyrhizobium sp. GM0.4]
MPWPRRQRLEIGQHSRPTGDSNLNACRLDFDECQKIIDDLLLKTNNLEDLSFWAGLPVPLNSLTDDTIAKLDNLTGDLTSRQKLYAQNVFRHWIERQDQVRCRLLEECLSSDDMTAYYNNILTSLTGVSVSASKPNVVVTFCIAEENTDCTDDAVGVPIQHSFGCNMNSKDDDAAKIICQGFGQLSAGARRIRTRQSIQTVRPQHFERRVLFVFGAAHASYGAALGSVEGAPTKDCTYIDP